MTLKIAYFINLLLTALLVGNELAISFFVHPVLSKLPQPVHLAAVQVIGRIYGRVMPVWMPVVIVSALPILYLIEPTSPAFIFTLVGLVCLAVMLAVSLLGNVPINNQVIAWNSQSPPANWLELRNRWDRLHVVRVVLDIAALTFILLGLLSHNNEC